jgi:7-cyano-7-deazaguanine synthase in queuosine biosynthesis
LRFLTEDVWQFEFVKYQGRERGAGFQRSLFPFQADPETRVALYSGGLDSFAGTAQVLCDSSGSNYVLVSGVTNPRQQAAQRSQVGRLSTLTSGHICHVAVPYGLRWAESGSERREQTSQRTRGFLFLTLGAISAVAAGASILSLYENGVGAINLPYNATQVGTYNSRATHPSTILKMEDFIKKLTGRCFTIENPFLFTSKGEMCRHEAVRRLADALPLTFSCDGFPVRARNRSQCGFCTSCLLRRQSMQAAGLSQYDASGYLNDLCSPRYVGSERHLHALRAMDWQVHRIQCAISRQRPWEALLDEFVELQRLQFDVCRSGEIQPSEFQTRVLRLYSGYVDEWQSFSARRLYLGRAAKIA